MPSREAFAQALAEVLRGRRDEGMARQRVLALLHEFDLSDDEAEAIIARGVALGILLDNGAEVHAT